MTGSKYGPHRPGVPCQPQAISSAVHLGGQALGHQRSRAHAAQVVGHVAVEG